MIHLYVFYFAIFHKYMYIYMYYILVCVIYTNMYRQHVLYLSMHLHTLFTHVFISLPSHCFAPRSGWIPS